MSNLYRGPSKDFSLHLAKRFQKSTNHKQELSVVEGSVLSFLKAE
jgi:hypothetical protein